MFYFKLMTLRQRSTIILVVFLLPLTGAACQPRQGTPEEQSNLLISTPDPQNLPTEFVSNVGQQVRQWATETEASSEYASPEWSAGQAIGAPDTNRCGDYQTAWATAGSDAIETLVLTYTLSVQVTGVNVIQSFNPNQVTKVELLDSFGRPTEIYNQPPAQIDQPCPYTLTIEVEKTEKRFNHIRITVDQSILGLGWNQIDAVELVGELE
jgi:hypothetical protein